MIDILKKLLNEKKLKYKERIISKEELRKIKNNFSQLKLVEIDSNKIVLVIYPESKQINSDFMKKNLNLKNYKFMKKNQLDNKINEILIDKFLQKENKLNFYKSENSILSIDKNAITNNFPYIESEFSSDKQYKVSIRNITPKEERQNLKNYKKCFLGLSLGNENFKGNRLKAILSYIDRNFDECNVLLADYIYRNTLQIQENILETAALKKALKEGSEVEKELLKLTSGKKAKFIITKCSNLLKENTYYKYLNEFKFLYSNNIHFRTSVLDFSEKFLKRNQFITKKDRDLSKNYLIEELAFAACIIEKGYSILFYPGDIQIFKDISNHNIENIPKLYEHLINIDLKIKS